MRYAEDLDFTVSRGDSCTGTGFCRQSMQKKNTQYSCYGHTDHGKETGADLLLSAFEILIKYVKKNKQINGFNIEIPVCSKNLFYNREMHNVNCRFCSAIHSVNQGMYKRHFTSHSQCK